MSKELQSLCDEILKDENGNCITPTCGIEKLLKNIVDSITDLSPIDDIDGGYPDNE